jgi:hypothetical protein
MAILVSIPVSQGNASLSGDGVPSVSRRLCADKIPISVVRLTPKMHVHPSFLLCAHFPISSHMLLFG